MPMSTRVHLIKALTNIGFLYLSSNGMDLENWMECLKDELHDQKLSEIVIPGTHDSGSYCITRKSKRTDLLPNLYCLNPLVDVVGATWSRTQDYSIADQLCLGVRYIDLRVFLDCDTNIKYLVHGFEAGELLKELEGVVKFVENHPGEIVILDMNHIYKCSNSDVCLMLKQMEEMFGDKLCPPSAPDSSVPTYGEMIDSGKKVIVAVTEKPEMFMSQYQHSSLKCQFSWVWSSETNVVSPWANTTDISTLRAYLERTMSLPRAVNSVHVTQTILTPTISDTLHGLYTFPHNLKQMAEQLNPHLPVWFEDFRKNLNLNIAIVDFLTPTLINHLINLNLTKTSIIRQ